MAVHKSFGPVRFLPGSNRGKYPFCNSVYVEGAGVLIDPASDRGLLKELRDGPGVREVWLSHWHEDHFMHLDLFEDVPFRMPAGEEPPLADPETFLDWYGLFDPAHRKWWREALARDFHYKPRKPASVFRPGDEIDLAETGVKAIHTPGHTPGHMSFLFSGPEVLFMGDYDLTRFGPWYGDVGSSIDQTIESVNLLRQVPARVWMTGHEHGLFEQEPGKLWDQYLEVIEQREGKLVEFLKTGPKTMQEIAERWIVYRKPREPKGFFEFGERAIMAKHLERLMAKGVVRKEADRYFIEI